MVSGSVPAASVRYDLAVKRVLIEATCLLCGWEYPRAEHVPGVDSVGIAPAHGLSCARPAVAGGLTEVIGGFVARRAPLVTFAPEPPPDAATPMPRLYRVGGGGIPLDN